MTTLADITGTYDLDPMHSTLGFSVRHAMVSKVRGAFNDFSGSAEIDGADLPSSSVTVTVKVDSVDTRQADRDAHLKGDDFFAVETFPAMTFTSTTVTPTAQGVDVTGQLTIRDQTREVTIPLEFTGAATDPMGNDRIGFEGSTQINRQDFGLTFAAKLDKGGLLVADEITLDFDIEAVKRAV